MKSSHAKTGTPNCMNFYLLKRKKVKNGGRRRINGASGPQNKQRAPLICAKYPQS